MATELHPDVQRVQIFFQMTYFTVPNNISPKEFTLKLIPGLADVGVLDVGMAPELYPYVWRRPGKSFN